MILLINKLSFTLCLLFVTSSVFSQEKIIEWLNQNVIPLHSTEPAEDDSDLAFLSQIASEHRIIGIGEASHNTKDYADLRFRIIKYLAENHGLKTIAFEGSYEYYDFYNRYILAENDIDLQKNVWYLEGYNLYSWLKEFNLDKPENEKIKIYGN